MRQPALGHRHADAVAAPLAQRAGRGLDARGQPILGMARALAAELAEPLDIVERDRRLAERLVLGIDRLDAGQMQHGVQQHRRVAVGEHEAVAVRPDRIVRVETQKVLPQRIGHRRQRHRRAGMARIGLLHGVHRQGADGVDAKPVECAGPIEDFTSHCGDSRIRLRTIPTTITVGKIVSWLLRNSDKVPGVVGVWTFSFLEYQRLDALRIAAAREDAAGSLRMHVAYLDADPADVTSAIRAVRDSLEGSHRAEPSCDAELLFSAPLRTIVPFQDW